MHQRTEKIAITTMRRILTLIVNFTSSSRVWNPFASTPLCYVTEKVPSTYNIVEKEEREEKTVYWNFHLSMAVSFRDGLKQMISQK